MIANAIPNGRSLGENKQVFALMEHLHRGFDRLDIPSVALHGERTERADEPRERGFFKKLGFCHEVQMIVERQTQPDEHGV